VFSDPRKCNHLLDALPSLDRRRLAGLLERVELSLGAVVHESGATQSHAYFPIDAIVSLIYVLKDGSSAEVAIVGHDGMIGMPILMGGGTSPHRAIVQAAGSVLRMKAQDLRNECERMGPLQQLLMHYNQALMIQIGQTAVCNRHHSVDQQLCRWLLMSIDRLPNNSLTMTQALIANMLGVRREGVTEAAGKLQLVNAITYQRGRITVLDRAKLLTRCCECYDVVQNEYTRLLPWDTTATIDQRGSTSVCDLLDNDRQRPQPLPLPG
jgi:CRP-like cAMP-binding protein